MENYPSLLTCRSVSDNGKLHKICDRRKLSGATHVPVTMRVIPTNPNQNNKPVITPTSNVDMTVVPLLPSSNVIPKVVKDDSLPKVPPDHVWKKKQSILDNHHYLRNIKVHR